MSIEREREISVYTWLVHVTGVCEKNNNAVQALAMQPSGKNCVPATELAFCKPMFPRVLFSGGVLFSQTPES